MTDESTVVDVFEEVLGVPFESKYIQSPNLDILSLKRLADALNDHYVHFTLPSKADSELRPYIFQRYTVAQQLAKDLETHAKAYLLYCHSLCIYDPLIPLLDSFRLRVDDTTLEARKPYVIDVLRQYATLADLLRHRILIPVSDEIAGSYSLPLLDEAEEQEMKSVLSREGFSERHINNVAPTLAAFIKEQISLKTRTSHRMDLFFPHNIYVHIFRSLLRAAQARFSSAQILEPFDVGLLGNIPSIRPDKISLENIVSLRNEEEAFEEFRAFLRGVFDRLHARSGYFSDFETEFAQAIRLETRDKAERIRAITRKSGVLRQIFTQSDRLAVYAVSGAAPGFLAGSTELAVLGAALFTAGRLVYDISRAIVTEAPSGIARASLHNHFLAVGAVEK
jgi:hypothetical protein